eukprot:SAG31_NODE_18819_length_621_cov_1.739464_1_plen_29_part_01
MPVDTGGRPPCQKVPRRTYKSPLYPDIVL